MSNFSYGYTGISHDADIRGTRCRGGGAGKTREQVNSGNHVVCPNDGMVETGERGTMGN